MLSIHVRCRFTAWPQDALQTTAERYLADSELPAELRATIGAQCMLFHAGVRDLTTRFELEAKRHFYITPTSYLELLNAYKALFAARHAAVSAAQKRYESGLEKLLFTEGQVSAMKAELEVLKPQLIAASADTEALLVDVKRETAEADDVKAVVSVDEAQAKREADKVTAIKEECEGDLAEAMPALNAAIKALDTLTKNDITEVKGMKSPPAAVKMVLEAVCIIKGLKATKVRPVHCNEATSHRCSLSQLLACIRQLRSHPFDTRCCMSASHSTAHFLLLARKCLFDCCNHSLHVALHACIVQSHGRARCAGERSRQRADGDGLLDHRKGDDDRHLLPRLPQDL